MENQNHPQPLFVERAAKWAVFQTKENKVPLLASFLFATLAYMFAFTNKLVNHDEVNALFFKGATVDSGRWGLGALDSILPNYSMPWIYGVITIVLIAISICIIIRIFNIRSKLLQVLLAGTIMLCPSLIGLFGYMYTSSSYAVAFILSVLAVWFIQKPSILYAIPALGCLILSLSIYQSYISISASLLVLILIQELLQEDKVIPVLKKGVYFVIFLVASLGLYYIATQIVLFITGTELNSYASGSITLSVSSLLNSFVLAYSSFWRFLTENFHSLIPTDFSRLLHWLCFGAAGVLLLLWGVRQKGSSIGRFLLLLVLIALLPLAINCMYLITSSDSIHSLVLYSFVAVYIFLAIIADAVLPVIYTEKLSKLLRSAALNLITVALTLILVVNTYIANECYLYLYLNYENSYTFYSTLFADLKMMPEFDEDTKIAIIGTKEEPEFYALQFPFAKTIAGISGFHPNSYSQHRFMQYYIGFSIEFASLEEIDQISNSPEYAEMAVYPYYGSVQMIGDILVVKLQ